MYGCVHICMCVIYLKSILFVQTKYIAAFFLLGEGISFLIPGFPLDVPVVSWGVHSCHLRNRAFLYQKYN